MRYIKNVRNGDYTEEKLNVKNIVFDMFMFLVVITLLSGITIVQAGTVRVVKRFGKVTEQVMYPGLNLKIPLIDSTLKYNTQKITYEASENPDESNATYTDYAVDTTTKDGQQVSLNYTVRFSADPTKAGWIANNIGREEALVEKVVKTDSRIHVRNIAREFNASDLYTGNVDEVQTKIEEVLRPIFEENGLFLDEFGLRSIKFGEEYINAIEAKQIEKEKVVTEEYKAEQEEFKKEQRITNAEGQAKEQELQRTTLTGEILQKMWIEKWNGTVPQVVTGNESLIFQLPQ